MNGTKFDRRLPCAALVALTLVLAGCGGSSSSTTKSSATSSTPAATTSGSSSSTTTSPASSSSRIPQGPNAGDKDSDNNGGPSDGDGNL